jgi:hypothetical protein
VRPSVSSLVGVTASAAALGAFAGCGSGELAADAPEGAALNVAATAGFESVQRPGSTYPFRLTIVNRESERSLPAATVTVTGFSQTIEAGDNGAGHVADPRRPVWIVDAPPRGTSTAYRDTWSFGPLEAGERRTFVWKLSPVRRGRHTLRWSVSADLDDARPVAAQKAATSGTLDVDVGP